MLRWLGIVTGLLLLLAVIGLVVVNQRIDGWVKSAVETYGAEYTGVAVTLDSVSLSLLNGHGELRGLTVANPDGYEGEHAIRVARVAFEVQPRNLLDDPIVIEHIEIEGAEVHAETRNLRETNLQVIQRNVRAATPPADPDAAPGRQVIIELLEITDTQTSVTAATLAAVAVRVPDLTLTEVGRQSNGASIGQVLEQILQPLLAAVMTSITEGRVRDLIDEHGSELRDRVDEEADRLRDRLRRISPF
ncbi:MAG: AsmA family protein [Gammaproteobacteria bacterium]|nr:AsmA family protein [Gammaproteobacteria bacterium]